MAKQQLHTKQQIRIERATLSDMAAVAALFTECFQQSVLHHCGGRLPKPQAMEDVFVLVYQAEPEAAFLARTAEGQVVGYCFAPTKLVKLWCTALSGGYLLKWAWRWATQRYGFGLHPLKIIVMNKVAFLTSSLAPCKRANARILSIAVAPAARGQGVASLLLEGAIAYFKSQQVERIRLEVRPDNEAALCVYRKWGFIEGGYTMDSQGKWLIMFKEMEHVNV